MDDAPPEPRLTGRTVAFVGRLASMGRREAAALARQHGAAVVDAPAGQTDLVVLGEAELPLSAEADPDRWLDPATREAVEAGRCEVVGESRFWQRLGLVDADAGVQQLYTPAMLAELVGVPVAVVRRWHRRGLIVPARTVRRLPYFDFQEVATARRLAELLATGMSPQAIEKKLSALARYYPEVERPLAQLSVIVRDKRLLLRQGEGLVEPGGQLHFDFDALESGPDLPEPHAPPGLVAATLRFPEPADDEPPMRPGDLCRLATELEELGQLAAAADVYRAALAAGGPVAEVCFELAEILYRLDDLAGARERYFMAIELDENYVEARANLGCVLVELGQHELAAAAFEGALALHPEYADAHYHLARALDHLGSEEQADRHWQAFLRLAPTSPWADEARQRLEPIP